MAKDYPVRELCAVLELSRGGYYAWRKPGDAPRRTQGPLNGGKGKLFRYSEIHVVAVIEDPAAIGTRNQLLLGLAGHDDLSGQAHVTTAADAMLDPNNDVLAFVPDQTIVSGSDVLVHGSRKLLTIPGQFDQFFFEILLAGAELS